MTLLSVSTAPPETGTEPRDIDPRDPVLRMEKILDPGSLSLLRERDDTGVCVARGRVALETLLTQKGYVDPAALERLTAAAQRLEEAGR